MKKLKIKIKVNKKHLLLALVCIALTQAVGFLSSYLSGDITAQYRTLIKPPFAPPGIVFAIVWPILYTLMGIAVSFIYREKTDASNQAFFWYLLQLLINFSWSIIFFRLEAYWAALLVLIVLNITVFHTITLFRKVNKTAAYLMIPYQIWILFAAYLNLGFALLN